MLRTYRRLLCRSFPFNEEGQELIDSRNNLGVVTLSPLLCALRSNSLEEFWDELEKATSIAKDALMFRIERFDTVTSDAAPILYQNGSLNVDLKKGEKVSEVFKDGFSSVSLGFLGLHECVVQLTGKAPYDCKDSYNLQMDILKFLDDKAKQWKKETGYGFSTYSTPNESTSLRLVRLYKEKYGEIKGVTDHVYLTNSFHVFPEKNMNAFDKIDFEAPFIKHSSGGFVTTVDMPNLSKNTDAHEALVDYAYDRVPYFLINQPVDECYKCGFEGEMKGTSEGYTCPECGNNEAGTMCCIRRVSGYICEPDARPLNPAKQNEVINRVKHV